MTRPDPTDGGDPPSRELAGEDPWSASTTSFDPGGALAGVPPATISLLRRFADLVVTDDIAQEEWAHLHDALEAIVGSHDGPDTVESQYAAAYRKALADDPSRIPDVRHPISIGATLVFPNFDLQWDGEVMHGTVTFGHAFEGPPGLVHGGFVATGFDVVVSAASWRLAPLMMTRRLNVRYFRPTPIASELHFEGVPTWIDEGKRVHVDCKLRDERGRTTARAEGESVSFRPGRFGHRFTGGAGRD